MRFLGIPLVLFLAANAAPPGLVRLEYRKAPAELRGGAADPSAGGRFFTWGARVHVWERGRAREVAKAPFGYDDGGCALDADGDGVTDLVLVRRSGSGPLGTLVWLKGRGFAESRIDTDVEMYDCRPAQLFGRSGFLMIHRHAQVRFYWFAGDRWELREVYSIYTASRQAGLELADVDGDGRADIFAGNYWVRSPEAFELPWRIFAIHLHHESEEAASFAYAAWPDVLVGAQRERMGAVVRVFRRPPDPRELWPETDTPGVRLDLPRAGVAFGDLAVIGHADGLFALRLADGAGAVVPGPAVLGLWVSGGRVYALSAGGVGVWRR
ncbi:MAG: VCBS repeat-containing protein [Acidobacteria bacterium]|nr:VCBS repeat-containing protein [Acidobacteriota bacterium]